ncbi:MAG: hypothetical protein RLZZ142_1558 [Verrucomicrobiota bacterium]
MKLFRALPIVALLLRTLAPSGSTAEIHVSLSGNDTASGSPEAPLRSIQAAAERARPGDTILVAPGTYRERIAPPRGGSVGAPIVFRSLQRHKAIVKGSDLWEPHWNALSDSIWSAPVDPNLFTDTSHADGANPFEVPSSSTPRGREGRPESRRGNPKANPAIAYSLGQLIVDGSLFMQAASMEELQQEPGSWFYVPSTKLMYVHFFKGGPAGHTLEITTRRRLFAPHQRGLGFLEIDGFVFEHCGNQYPFQFAHPENTAWQQAGAVGTRSGHDWIIRNNIIRLANGIGLDLGSEGNRLSDLETPASKAPEPPGRHLVEGNFILNNGASGIAAYQAEGLILRENIVLGNNAWGFRGDDRTETAGIKLHRPDNALIHHNYIAYNSGSRGLHFEGGAGENSTITSNLLVGQDVGIEFETGPAKPCLVANNVIVDNKIGISLRESGGITALHNSILGSDLCSLRISIDEKRPGNWSASDLSFLNNLFGGKGTLVEAPPKTSPRGENRSFDFNLYNEKPGDRRFKLGPASSLSFLQWQEGWKTLRKSPPAELHSNTIRSVASSLDPTTNRLILALSDDITPRHPVTRSPHVTADFFNVALPTATPALPGAFQQVKEGRNELQAWSGLAVPTRRSPWAQSK